MKCYRCKKKAIFHYTFGSSCLLHNKLFLKDNSREGKLEYRTIKIIERDGRIVLKRSDGFYLSNWSNIAAGWDKASWSSKRNAMEIFNLEMAFALAPLFKCKVFVLYPKGK